MNDSKPSTLPITLSAPTPDEVKQRRRYRRIGLISTWSCIVGASLGTIGFTSIGFVWLGSRPLVDSLVVWLAAVMCEVWAASEIVGGPGLRRIYHQNNPSACWMHLYDDFPPGTYSPDGVTVTAVTEHDD